MNDMKKPDASIKKRVFDIIQISNVSDGPSRLFDIFLAAVIGLNILAMFLETFPELSGMLPVFDTVETVTVSIFCVEYILRLWTAEYLYPEHSRAGAVWRFMCSLDGIVELLTILPFFFLSGAVAFRMMRVVRIFHLFRINSNTDSFHVITTVLKERSNQILSSLFIILVLMLASSLCMYSVEHQAQPEAFRNALSGMWWSVSALLTVGYGDVYPVTALGRALAVVISFLGVGAVAIPTGIISAGFVEQYQKAEHGRQRNGRIREVRLHPESRFVGRTVGEAERDGSVLVLLIRRGGENLRPGQDEVLRAGDALTLCENRKRA